jgi:AraC family ethanolamine operon transcriptional activator
MARLAFPSFDAYAAEIQQATIRAMFLGPQQTNWALSYVTMNNLSIQWGKDGGANIMEGTSEPGGITFFVPCKNENKISGNGRQMDTRSLMILVPGDEFCISASDWNRWFSMWISHEALQGMCGSTDALVGLTSRVVQLSSATTFRSFADKLRQALHEEPTAFDSVAAIAATERKLADGVTEALDFPSASPAGRHTLPRRQIIRQVRDFVDQHRDEYLSVADLASAAGSSERTLRTAFQEYFSVGPIRYLNVRTLHLAREALRANDSSTTTVAEVLTRFGVWEFGRFARDYRTLFGELPSQTLRKNF